MVCLRIHSAVISACSLIRALQYVYFDGGEDADPALDDTPLAHHLEATDPALRACPAWRSILPGAWEVRGPASAREPPLCPAVHAGCSAGHAWLHCPALQHEQTFSRRACSAIITRGLALGKPHVCPSGDR